MNKILIIVDFQKDFCEKTGSLYVPGAEIAKENILKYLDTEKPDAVCFTLDWHTRHDESFKRNGGIWPDHCIQYSEGAALDQDILRKCIDNNILYVANGYEPHQAWRKEFSMKDFHYLTVKELPENVTFKIRHTPEFHKATLRLLGDDTYGIFAEDMIQGVAPGQFCVIYDAEHHKCYGSGEIEVCF